MLQNSGAFLPREDEDIADEIKMILETKGIHFAFNIETRSITREGDTAVVHALHNGKEVTFAGKAVLVAVGRRPNTDGLHAQAAGVALTQRGGVQVDDRLRTTAENIWAMGDVTGGVQHTYVSLDDYRIIRSRLDGGEGRLLSARKTSPTAFLSTRPMPGWG